MSPIELQVDHMHSTESLGIQVCRLVYRDRAKSHVIVMLQGDNPLTNFDSALKLFKQAHPDFTYSITEDEKFRVTNGTATFEFERESNSYARTVVIAMLELMIERNKGDWS